jgi:uncharacterized membrane protein YoaK (UPF0700 family)
LLVLRACLLVSCLGLGVGFDPFTDADWPTAVLVGMLAVAAMATQNALVRLAFPGTPSTTVMTTNITQLTIDLTTLARRRTERDDLATARQRAGMIFSSVGGFVVGCAAGAVLEVHFGLWALSLPVGLSVIAIPLGETHG